MSLKNPENFLERLQFLADSDKTSAIAEWCDLPYSTINNYVQDPTRQPSAELSLKLAETKGVNIHWLLTGIGQPLLPTTDEKKSVTESSQPSYGGDGGVSSDGPTPQAADERIEQLVIQIPAFEVRMTLPRGAEVPQNIDVAIPLIRATKTEEKKG